MMKSMDCLTHASEYPVAFLGTAGKISRIMNG